MPKGYPADGLVHRGTAKNLASGRRVGHKLKAWFSTDPDTFNAIRDLAIKNNTSFSEQLRLLVEWGLECVE